ncbi:PAS domain S-box protein [Croceimicrobium hydrocarbonivorans]|uniref:histidine kinase n=1 Tax=Croceimicrobium hydrocarbonivorans TaxID=2761580 RepID=A0A7H0VEP1_9FLAO|nr:PAS domain S-box protein [Croceimicrobium hydrocarbonivorans]QNR24189.1 PAS domain S-box protein [Croceimicrobium hydrocarbonivorans]
MTESNPNIQVLCIESQKKDQEFLKKLFSKFTKISCELRFYRSVKEALADPSNLEFQLCLISEDQLAELPRLINLVPTSPFLVLGTEANTDRIPEALAAGASNYLLKSSQMGFELEKSLMFCQRQLQLSKKLELTERQNQTLFKVMPESMVITRQDNGHIVSVNDTFTEVFGYRLEDCIGKTSIEIGLWDDLRDRESIFVDLPNNGEVRDLEIRLKRKDNHTIPCHISFSTYQYMGTDYLMSVIVSQEKAENQRRELELEKERFRTLVESAPDLFFYTRDFNAINYVCPQVYRHLGYTEEEVLKLSYHHFLTEKSKSEFAKIQFPEFMKKGESKVLSPFELVHKSGKVKQYELYLIPVKNKETGWVEFIQGIARDISDELETFEMLKLSNQRNLEALEELKAHQYAIDQHNMVVITDLDGKVKFANDNFCKTSGYSRKELIGSSTRILNSGLHDDAFFAHLWNTVLDGNVWKGNVCNRHKDGHLYWLSTTIIPRKDQNGEVYEFIALRTDISELKEAEKALKTSQENLANILNSNPHEIWSVDREFKLLTLNPNFRNNFAQHFNHDLKIGQLMTEIPGFPDEIAILWKDRYSKAFTGESHSYQDHYHHPISGKLKHLLVSIYPTLSEDGTIVGANVFSQDITERQEAKEELKVSNIRLEEAQAMAMVADWEYLPKEDILTSSNNMPQILGLADNSNLLDRKVLARFDRPHRSEIFHSLKLALYQGESTQNFWLFHTPQGKELWLECKIHPECNPDGEISRIRGVVRDVTEIIHLQKKEYQQKRIFIDLANSSSDLLRLNEINQVYDALSESIYQWFNEKVVVGSGAVTENGLETEYRMNHCIIPPKLKKAFTFLEKAASSNQVFPSVMPIIDGLRQGKVFKITEDLIYLLPFLTKETVDPIFKAFPHFELIAIGISYNNAYKGTTFVFFPEGTPDYYSDQLLEVLGNQASTVMELIEYRNELRDNALILNQALKAAGSAIFYYDLEKRRLDGDPKLYELMGASDRKGNPIHEEELTSRMSQEDIQRMLEFVYPKSEQYIDTYQFDFRFYCLDDKWRWFEDRAKIVRRDKNGKALEIVGIRTDVTERKERENQLLLLESTVTNANEGILITDARDLDGDGPYIIYANKAFERISGYTLEEVKGKSPQMLQGPDTDPLELERIAECLSQFKPVGTELINYSKEGIPYYVSISIVPVLNDQGEVTHFVALERDTTEEHRQKAELKELLMRFELATKANTVGIWDLNLADNEHLEWDDNMFRLYQRSPDNFNNRIEDWISYIHPEDRDETAKAFQSSVEQGLDDVNFRFRIRAGNQTKHIAAISKVVRDHDGNPKRIVGLNWDVTELELKRLELEQMRLNTEALINSTDDHMWSINVRFRLLSANKSYLQFLQNRSDHAFNIGDSVLNERLGENHLKRWKGLYERAFSGEQVNVQIEDQSQYGDQIFAISLYPIYNDARVITGVACYSLDVTERTHYLETIEQQNQKLKDIAWMQSHVMRAPVARILGLIALLKEENYEGQSASTQEILQFINESTEEMDQVIKDITAKTERFKLDLQ